MQNSLVDAPRSFIWQGLLKGGGESAQIWPSNCGVYIRLADSNQTLAHPWEIPGQSPGRSQGKPPGNPRAKPWDIAGQSPGKSQGSALGELTLSFDQGCSSHQQQSRLHRYPARKGSKVLAGGYIPTWVEYLERVQKIPGYLGRL